MCKAEGVSMPRRDIVVLGASAGGVEALLSLARALPTDLDAALFVVLHLSPHGSSVLPQLLNRAGGIRAAHAVAGERVRPGRWYVAPPDHHLLIALDETVHLGRGPAENGHRPAVDPLFRSAARVYGQRVIAGVLSGSLDDGTAGLLAVKLAGGVAIVQDPSEALYPSMPQNAILNVEVDHVCPVQDLARVITRLVQASTHSAESIMNADLESSGREAEIAEDGPAAIDELQRRGSPSAFACPDCHGVLWELHDGDLVRYRCRVGHAYLPQSLSVAQSDRLEESLWVALRTLKESSALSRRLAARARERRMLQVVATYEARAADAEQRAAVIEEILKRGHLSASVEDAIPADNKHALSEKTGSED
jgi:two-component system, chemotaxis family, protein-glutamate methylesterase/glutaminase